ncbi:hypothetical protein MNBD_ALPHA12-230 [hydrothermal vent metagenome]|uniref:Uncharacterized protein n=1 Tax=hydrothermal vent metagenome TaxID=652676 RepID=A0A3B0UAM3_9ZZZZ
MPDARHTHLKDANMSRIRIMRHIHNFFHKKLVKVNSLLTNGDK